MKIMLGFVAGWLSHRFLAWLDETAVRALKEDNCPKWADASVRRTRC